VTPISVIDELISAQSLEAREHFHIDWAGIESELGIRLPDEYKLYAQTFPPGETRIGFRVFHPLQPGPGALVEHLPRMSMSFQSLVDERRERLAINPQSPVTDVPFNFYPELGGLIPWAAWEINFVLCWDPTTADPNAWPIVGVTDGLRLERLQGSTLECLLMLATGDERPAIVPEQFWEEPTEFERYEPQTDQ
jgi:hypothetical protein